MLIRITPLIAALSLVLSACSTSEISIEQADESSSAHQALSSCERGDDCSNGTVCYNGYCASFLPAGSPCSDSYDCASLACENSVCLEFGPTTTY